VKGANTKQKRCRPGLEPGPITTAVIFANAGATAL
jgi:hypothetical protein